MKKLLLSIFIASCSVLAVAQDFSVARLDTTFVGSKDVSDFGGKIGLINNTNSSLALKWKRIDNDKPTDWQTSVCDASNCYPYDVDSANFSLPVSGFNNLMNVHFYPYQTFGLATVKVKVENRNDPSNAYNLTFIGDARDTSATTGVFDNVIETVLFNYYNDQIQITTQKSIALSANIYNLTGQIVENKSGFGSNLVVSTSNLQEGIYLVEYTVGTTRIVEKVIVR